MPMDFPDMKSLIRHADMLKFRKPMAEESEAEYRTALANHVEPMDFVESQEIRNKKGWNKFSEAENLIMLLGRRDLADECEIPHPALCGCERPIKHQGRCNYRRGRTSETNRGEGKDSQ